MHLPHATGDYDILEGMLGGSDNFAVEHRVIKTDVFFNRRCPEWAKHDNQIKALLLRSFPKLATDRKQRVRAARWLRIIHHYFREGRSASHTAEIMNLPFLNVQSLIVNIKRAADNKGCRRGYIRKNKHRN